MKNWFTFLDNSPLQSDFKICPFNFTWVKQVTIIHERCSPFNCPDGENYTNFDNIEIIIEEINLISETVSIDNFDAVGMILKF